MNVLTRYLEQYFDELEPIEFYRNIFNNELQEKGTDQYYNGKLCGIAVEVTKEKNKNGKNKILRHTITNDLEKISEMCSRDNFCLMSPIAYVGKSRSSENAKVLYAIAVDLDGVRIENNEPVGLRDLFHQIETVERIPLPTYIVSSGTGLHLYYVLKKPILLFDNVVEQLQKFKREITRIIWQGYITDLENNVQYESLFQGFRVVGTITKKGKRARVFETGNKVTMEYLNEFVLPEFQVTELGYKSNLTLFEAKSKYPEWYQKRVIEGKQKGTWTCKRDLYDWWKNRIKLERKTGHRYYCIMCLAIYRRKSGITKEELETDAFNLVERFDLLSENEDNRFTEGDVLDGLQAYDDKYMTYPINSIEYVTGIRIEKNKRNYRKQNEHLKIARFIRDMQNPDGWINKDGRPNKKQIIKDWQLNNPDGSKAQCIRETGLSKGTVYKWWKKSNI